MKLPLHLPRLRRRAFTILELLVVVVVIGILASLALVRFGQVQEKAYIATMQSDLRNFASARAIHIADDGGAISGASSVTNYSFSDFVFDAGYQGGNATEWALLVGHNKTETKCLLSTLASNGGAHRIECSTSTNLNFTANPSGTTVTVDAGPAISALAFAGESSVFAALAATDADISLVSWSWGDGSSTSGTPAQAKTATHNYSQAGEKTITLTLVKKSGGVKTGSKTVDMSNQSPTASFTVPSGSLTAGQSIALDASASVDPEGGALTYAWSFGNSQTSTAGPTTSVTYSTRATYTVTLTVSDPQGGSASTTRTITLVNAAPVPNVAVASGTLEAGQTVTFTAAGSTDDGSIASYAWSFSNGGTATGETASKSFTQGNHTVTLTVTDNEGQTSTLAYPITVSGAQLLLNSTRLDQWAPSNLGSSGGSIVYMGSATPAYSKLTIPSQYYSSAMVSQNTSTEGYSYTLWNMTGKKLQLTETWQTFYTYIPLGGGGGQLRIETVARTNAANVGREMCADAMSVTSTLIQVSFGFLQWSCTSIPATYAEVQSIKMYRQP